MNVVLRKIFSIKCSKALLSLALTVSLAFSMIAIPKQKAYADSVVDDIYSAASTSNTVLKALGCDKCDGFLAGLSSFAGYATAGLGITSMVLNIFGIGGDNHAFEKAILKELDAIREDIANLQTHIDAELTEISNKIDRLEIKGDYKNMIDTSNSLWSEWHKIQASYIEPLDITIGEYKTAVTSNIKAWYLNENQQGREKEEVNNKNIPLVYETNQDNVETLKYSAYNGVAEEDKDKKYIVIKEAAIPSRFENFSVDTYQSIVKAQIMKSLRDTMDKSIFVDHYLDVHNYKIFTKLGWAAASNDEKEAALEKVSSDAVEMIVYRNSVCAAREKIEVVQKMSDQFSFLCRALCDNMNYGLYAPLKALCLSHGFEGEIKDELVSICSWTLVKLDQDAMMVLDCVGKSNGISDSVASTVASSWKSCVDNISNLSSTMITGNDDYCYVAKSRLQINQGNVNVQFWSFCGAKGYLGIKNKILTHPEYGYNKITDQAAQLLCFVKSGNPLYDGVTFEDYISQYLKTEYPEYNSSWGEPNKPRICLLDSTYTEGKYSGGDNVTLTLGALWYSNDFGHYINPSNLPKNAKVQDNLNITVAKVLDTQTALISTNDYLTGAYSLVTKDGNPVEVFSPRKYELDKEPHANQCHSVSMNGEIYSLVVPKEPEQSKGVLLQSGNPNNNFIVSLNSTIDKCSGNSLGSIFGSGNIALIIAISALGIAVIVALIIYSRKQKSKHKKE